jgi:hypothetical protein
MIQARLVCELWRDWKVQMRCKIRYRYPLAFFSGITRLIQRKTSRIFKDKKLDYATEFNDLCKLLY